MNDNTEKVERLQKNLSLIRTCIGWNATTLGDKLGVSRQMISNLENYRNTMTMMQYLAIRQVIAEEIEASSDSNDTQMIKDIIGVLVDNPDKYSDEERQQVLDDANLLAPSIVSQKTSRKNATAKWAFLAGAVIASAAVTATAIIGIKSSNKE